VAPRRPRRGCSRAPGECHKALVSAGATTLTADFSDVRFIDSSGVGALLEGQRLGVTLVIRNPAASVRRVLEIVGVDSFATIENP
jgi:anti-anti-sigma factor